MEMIELLAEHGADLRCRDNASWDLLMYASRLGREDLVRYFALHVNPNYKTVRTGNVLLSLNFSLATHRVPSQAGNLSAHSVAHPSVKALIWDIVLAQPAQRIDCLLPDSGEDRPGRRSTLGTLWFGSDEAAAQDWMKVVGVQVRGARVDSRRGGIERCLATDCTKTENTDATRSVFRRRSCRCVIIAG